MMFNSFISYPIFFLSGPLIEGKTGKLLGITTNSLRHTRKGKVSILSNVTFAIPYTSLAPILKFVESEGFLPSSLALSRDLT